MADYTEDDLYEMSDEEALAAFKAAKADLESPDTELEQEAVDDTVVDSAEEEIVDDVDEVDDVENELESDLEQPEEDSDHDTSTEDDVEESDADEPETTDEDADGDVDSEDEDNSEEEEEAKEDEVQPVLKHTFKANGKEYEFTDDEIKSQFPKIFGQAMDYTKKMQAIKPYRKTIDALEQAGLKHDDVNLMIDVLKGDKEAISEVIKRTGVDTLDLDTENNNYVAKDYGRDDHTLAIKDVIDDISRDAEFGTTKSILEERWDEASWNKLSADPQLIKELHIDVQNGMYDKLQPRMDKMKVFNPGKSDLEYYGMAAQEYYQEIAQEEQRVAAQEAQRQAAEQERIAAERAEQERRLADARSQEQTRKATKQASAKRKAAAPTKSVASAKPGVIDYLNADDGDFEEWYKQLKDV